jgi:hypothetical protein
MMHKRSVDGELFALLTEWDAQIARAVSMAGCRHCGGPLYQSNYQRKPRGGLLATDGEAFNLRHSLCCGQEGCRKRALPPSLRFLGRRVYLEIVVVLASVWAMVARTVEEAVAGTGVPERTLSRWGCWWRGVFPLSATWSELRARFVPPPPAEDELPNSLVQRVEREVAGATNRPTEAVLFWIARSLAPTTTASVVDGARFLRDVAARMQPSLLAQKM